MAGSIQAKQPRIEKEIGITAMKHFSQLTVIGKLSEVS